MKFIRYLLIVFLLLFSSVSFCQSDLNSVKQDIATLINNSAPEAHVGILVHNLQTNKMLYSQDANKLYTPASTLKLFTFISSYLMLGENFQFSTSIYINESDIAKSKYKSNAAVKDLYFKFSGDPELTTLKLKKLIANLKKSNINKIEGNIVIDDTLFSGVEFGDGWTWDSNQWHYSVPITAAMVNSNKVSVNLSQPKKLADILQASFAFNQPKGIKIKSSVKAVTHEQSMDTCRININASNNNTYNLTGCWPFKDSKTTLQLAIANPRVYLEKQILQELRGLGVNFSGKFVYKKFADTNLKQLAVVRSRKLKDFAQEILLSSNNIYTEALTKTMGAKIYNIGDFKHGVLAIKATLSKFAGIDFDTIDIFDGSGLSRYNLISPIQFNKLLLAASKDKKLYQFLLTNMHWQQAKKEHIKARYNKFTDKFDISAKTGSLSGVAALSGYLTTRNNNDIAFTVLVNGFKENKKQPSQNNEKIDKSSKKLIDDLSKLFYEEF